MSKGIRRYGPGKFNTILDSIIYDMVGEGMGDESCGDVSEVGFYAEKISLGKDSVKEAERIAKEHDGLTEEEVDRLKSSVGAIMVESEQGFVTVDYYDKEKELEKDWEEIQEDASSEDDEDEDEDEDGDEEEEEEEAEEEEADEVGE